MAVDNTMVFSQRQESLRLENLLENERDFLHCQVLHVAPVRPREGQIVAADGTDWNPGRGAGLYVYIGGEYRAMSSPVQVIQGTVSGKPANGQIVSVFPVPVDFVLPVNLVGSRLIAGTAATGVSTFILKKNGTQFATAVFAAGGTAAVFTAADGASFSASASDTFTITAPSTADATLANIGWAILGVET